MKREEAQQLIERGVKELNEKIRLACSACDRDDYDGVSKLPGGWSNITKIQSWQESLLRVQDDDQARSVFQWYTHLGTCPDCQRELS